MTQLNNRIRALHPAVRGFIRKMIARDAGYLEPKAREIARRERRILNDLHAAARNYKGWCAKSVLSIQLF